MLTRIITVEPAKAKAAMPALLQLKVAIANVLKEEGFIEDFKKLKKATQAELETA
ncbi:30S ribosomal protein S8 [Salmonella enterica subsp. enterica]|nr:30S ribosomal protein S8 [Salmonella enterica subsp. enterica]